MRRILVEQRPPQAAAEARRRAGDASTSTTWTCAATAPPDDLLALDEALDRLAAEDPAKAELVKLRYFAGLSIERGRRGPRHLAAQRPTATGPTPGPGCSASSSGERADRERLDEFLRIRERDPAAIFALACRVTDMPIGSSRSPWLRTSPSVEAIFRDALEIDSAERAGRLPRRGLRRRPGAAAAGRGAARRARPGGQLPGSPDRRRRRHGRPRRSPEGPARSSAPTSCWSRSARGAWASSTWPSRRSRSAARWR